MQAGAASQRGRRRGCGAWTSQTDGASGVNANARVSDAS